MLHLMKTRQGGTALLPDDIFPANAFPLCANAPDITLPMPMS